MVISTKLRQVKTWIRSNRRCLRGSAGLQPPESSNSQQDKEVLGGADNASALAQINVGQGKHRIEEEVLTGIGNSSFNPDVHSGEMAAIGAAPLLGELDSDQIEMLHQFGNGQGTPAMVIKGLPLPSPVPPTFQRFGDDAEVQFSDCLHLAAIEAAGLNPIALTYENHARVFRNVAPSSSAVEVASSHGSQVPLPFHTDNPCAPFEDVGIMRSPIPRFLTFFGLRNADGNGLPVPTEILMVHDLLKRARSGLIRDLELPQFIVHPPASNKCGPYLARVVEYDQGAEPLVRFNAADGQIEGQTSRAQKAIKELCELLRDCEDDVIKVIVDPGTIFMFDNYRVLHRRRSFDPGKDLSKARWLRRCFACQSPANGILVDRIHRPLVWK